MHLFHFGAIGRLRKCACRLRQLRDGRGFENALFLAGLTPDALNAERASRAAAAHADEIEEITREITEALEVLITLYWN